MLNKAIENSGFMGLAKEVRRWQAFILACLASGYKESRLYSLCRAFRQGSVVNFKHAFLVRVIRETKQNNRAVIKNARLPQFFSSLFQGIRFRLFGYLRTSRAGHFYYITKQEIHLPRIKIAGLFLLVVVLTNTSLLLLMKKEMTFISWFSRAILLLVAIVWLSCGYDWQRLEETSLMVKYINRHFRAKD